MAIKTFEIDALGTVRVSKRRGTRHLRLSIAADGEIRVSIPAWAPYVSGIDFAKSKSDWITQNSPDKPTVLAHGHRVGKAHQLAFMSAAIDTPSSRMVGTEIRISRPMGMAVSHPEVQKVAHRASIRALRSQAEVLLPQRLKQLADKGGFDYGSISVKQLKGRWGSCDHNKDIVLNLFLMQLPWQLIDYVLIHELTHTRHLNHSAEFWAEFERHEPRAKYLRKVIKRFKPVLMAVDTAPVVT